MQLVSRKVFFDIMSHKHPVRFKAPKSLDETDESSSAFQTFMRSAGKIFQNSKGDVESFNNGMFFFMRDNQDCIRYVNEGSSRIVYSLADGTALKVAKTEAGVAQNKQEAKNCMNPKFKYAVFPDFYAADTDHWIALNCELCTMAAQSDFAKLLKIQLEGLCDVIEFIIKNRLDDWNIDKVYKHFMSNGSSVYARFALALLKQETKPMRTLHSLLDFYRRNKLEDMELGDLESFANWGLAMRDNQQVLVIIDAGFSEDIYNTFYK